jgi:Leucine-rich repeat (LRR) protein
MRNILILLPVLLLFVTCNKDEDIRTNITDDNFEQKLIELGYDDILDGYVLPDNVKDVIELNVSNSNISDLSGIEDFISLTSLSCDQNQLTSLDVSNNTSLELLYCYSNENLTCVKVSQSQLTNIPSGWQKDSSSTWSTDCN